MDFNPNTTTTTRAGLPLYTTSEKYTAPSTPQYKAATENRAIRYTIEGNLAANPEVVKDFNLWRSKQKNHVTPSFERIYLNGYSMPLIDLRKVEIREDYGQRNALEKTRQHKTLGIAKKFDPFQYQPVDVDYLKDEAIFILRDGGGRGTAAYLNGVFMVPASVRIVESYKDCRRLFNLQDKYNTAISSYDKFLGQLMDPDHSRHAVATDTWGIAAACGFCLNEANKVRGRPQVEGISTLQRVIRTVGGDHKDVKWGNRSAPDLATAIDIIKATFPEIEDIPVSALEAITAFVHISKNRIPSGQEGKLRLQNFFASVRDLDPALASLENWTTTLCFDSSNNYATYGASALMGKWNEIFKNSNKGRTASYRFVKWSPAEINITKMDIMVFARDESLYTNIN